MAVIHGVLDGLKSVGIDFDQYVDFCLYGSLTCRTGVMSWADILLESGSLRKAICVLMRIPCDSKKKWANKSNVINIASGLLFIYRWVLYTKILRCKWEVECSPVPIQKLLSVTYIKAIDLYLSQFSVAAKFPIIHIKIQDPISMSFTRKKHSAHILSDRPINVPSFSARGGKSASCDVFQMDKDERAMVAALQDLSKTVQCGNPFYHMMTRLCFKKLMTAGMGVIPIGHLSRQSVYDVAIKFIGTRVLRPVFRLPILSCKLKNVAENGHAHKIIVCVECGHCLNLGRGKFISVNFSPTSVFYCRDQKEKQFNICATTGRIYCSYCGSTDFSMYDMVDRNNGQSYIRAVISSNAIAVCDNPKQHFEVLVPCFGKSPCCSIKHNVTLTDLLYLTNSLDNFICSKCASKT